MTPPVLPIGSIRIPATVSGSSWMITSSNERAANRFASYENHVVAIANLANYSEVFFGWRNDATCVTYRLYQNTGDRFRVFMDDHIFERAGGKSVRLL